MKIHTVVKHSAAALFWAFLMMCPVEAQQFDWQEIELPVGVELTDVAASPDRLVAVGYSGSGSDVSGVAYTSANARDWQPLALSADGVRFGVVAFVDGAWLIGRSDGDLHRSTDGLSWTRIQMPQSFRSDWNSILEIDGEIWSVGRGLVTNGRPNTRIVSSADLVDWEVVHETGSGTVGGPFLRNVVGSPQLLVGLAFDPPPSVPPAPRLFSSADGSSWSGFQHYATDLIWDGERFQAIFLWDPTVNSIVELIPGGEWQIPAFTSQASRRFQLIAASAPYLLLANDGPDPIRSIAISPDGGNEWTEQDVSALRPDGVLREIIAWRNVWVGVGDSIVFGTQAPPRPVPALDEQAGLLLTLLLLLPAALVFSASSRQA